MRFYKQIVSNYIISVGTGNGGTEITETEYNEILTVIRNKPQATATTDYRLKTDLTWEVYEVEPVPEPEPEPQEILDILLGGEAE